MELFCAKTDSFMRKSAICRIVGSGITAFSNNSGVANLAIVAIVAIIAIIATYILAPKALRPIPPFGP